MEPPDSIDSNISLKTAAAELRYARSLYTLGQLAGEERSRRLRGKNLILQKGVSSLHNDLHEETESRDAAESDAQHWQCTADEANRKLDTSMSEARMKARELENLKTELSSLHSASADSAKFLSEKLSLVAEISRLRPELEHLRRQAESNESVLAEKLSLQRELSNVKAELNNERIEMQRAQANQNQKTERNSQQEKEIEELQQELAKERRERERRENSSAREHERKLNELKAELEEAKRELEQTQQSSNKSTNKELKELEKEVAKEKKSREQAEKRVFEMEANFEAKSAALEDRLDQFRTKLRSTKEKLKDTENELEKTRAAAIATSKTQGAGKAGKGINPRKRSATQMIDSDVTTGTPGDLTKRIRRPSTTVGEKSTFSITPFLNRTTSVPPGSGPHIGDKDEPIPSIETSDSPSANRSTNAPDADKPTSGPLAPASPSKLNLKTSKHAAATTTTTKHRRNASIPSKLDKVAEDEPLEFHGDAKDANNDETGNVTTHSSQPSDNTTTNIFVPSVTQQVMLKPKAPSLSSFASFREGSLPPQQQKRKRKLLGSTLTLFDENEEDESTGSGRTAGGLLGGGLGSLGSLGAQRGFGMLGGRGLGALGGLGKKKGPTRTAEDGFMFSPLKKDRKAMGLAAAGGPQSGDAWDR